MIRIVIENLLLFLLPTLLYFSVAYMRRRDGASSVAILNDAPMLTLAVLGALLVFGVMAVFGSIGDGKPGQAYEPAQYKDGKVVPGRMK
jgi:Family of unknown function (DUF6111)